MAGKSFITCLSEYRKKYGLPSGRAPKKGTEEYEAVMAMMRGEKSKPEKASKAEKAAMRAEVMDKKTLAAQEKKAMKAEEKEKKRMAAAEKKALAGLKKRKDLTPEQKKAYGIE
jgi:hypothetical protein